MRRRSNKPKVVWLPPTAENSVDPVGNSTWQLINFAINVGAAGDFAAAEIPVVLDGTQSDPLNPTSSLADIQDSGYRLRRIVGKLYLFIAQTATPPTTGLFGVSAGFMVRRTNESSGVPQSANTGASMANSIGPQNIHPALIGQSMDPWIWRRTWLMANNGPAGTTYGDIPGQNFGGQYPGPLEGPHIDQKTARIIGQEERLFLDIGITNIFGTDVTTSLVGLLEVRVLASMRTTIGNRRNASR